MSVLRSGKGRSFAQDFMVSSCQNQWGFPGGASGRESLPIQVDVRNVGSIAGLGRYPGGEYSNPLQYSCLENPMDRGS